PNKKKTDCKNCGIFSDYSCNYWICRSIETIFRSGKTSRFYNNDFRFHFSVNCKRNLLVLLQKSKSKEEAHMKASMIFTSNDVIINLGVITAGLLVNWLNSNKPDLIIGTIVFVLVIQGAVRILKLGK